MTANVPTIDSGRASDGMIVAERFRRKRKITITTRKSVSSSVNFTSDTDARMVSARSRKTCRFTLPGSCFRNAGSSARTLSDTCTAFVPGCFWIERTIPRLSLSQAAC
ncbi:MAG: hypothetical protein QOK37_4717 [Thermoanaerobaculia bacterium]|jgi:hypothetical protein|nr:hypothetical protein [Thermoanaerobaculia bacterium]